MLPIIMFMDKMSDPNLNLKIIFRVKWFLQIYFTDQVILGVKT